MSKRSIIIIVSILILIGLIGGYLAFRRNAQEQIQEPQTGTGNPFPTGNNVTSKPPATENSTSTTFIAPQQGGAPAVKLTKIVDAAVTDGSIVEKTNGTNVQFLDRATGNAFRYNLEGGFLTRVSNTTIPKTVQSLWSADGEKVILQYLNDKDSINTYTAAFAAATSSASTTVSNISEIELRGKLMPSNIETIVLSPNTTRVFYMIPTSSGADGYIANLDGTKPVKIFSSPLTEWIAAWPEEGTIVLTTKPGAGARGFSYSLNTKTGALSPLLSNIEALMLLPNPTMTKVAYSDDSGKLKIFTTKDGSSIELSLSTMPEKCVWSKKDKDILYCAAPSPLPPAIYPDEWYQGIVSFTDSIYRINTTANTATVVVQPFTAFQQDIDAVNLSLNSAEDYLIFSNKKDFTLWAITLK